MNAEMNPYEAPQSRIAASEDAVGLVQAERWRRFVNLVIDYLASIALAALFAIALAFFGGQAGLAWLDRQNDLLFGIVLTLAYYVPLEFTFGRTLGKLITGTRVVDEKGGPPSLGKILGRSLCRFIPFEPFSFFSADARGWHDSIPRTYVVKVR
jgi:uncharacterized RDD family membrane protein YckC